jgi:hypothetical protein
VALMGMKIAALKKAPGVGTGNDSRHGGGTRLASPTM